MNIPTLTPEDFRFLAAAADRTRAAEAAAKEAAEAAAKVRRWIRQIERMKE